MRWRLRPSAFRSAETIAAGATTFEGSPTPLAPNGVPVSGSSTSSTSTFGMSSVVGSR